LLIDRRGFSLSQLNYDKYRLKTSIANKMDIHRQAARFSVYQTFLNLNSPTPLVVTPENCFSFDPKNYPYSYPLKSSRYVFKKHYYPEVGNLNDTGEEFECAQFIDQLDEIDFWVRNIEHRSRNSFWLQTKTDKFYPDFVCKLKDGRFLVIEYKGEHLWSGDDAKEKRALGELWAARSNGKCLFIMPKGKDFKAIEFLTKRQ
jgi:type III restriction enzyme